MPTSFKQISHKKIDSLSDGVFSIALTLLGLDVLSLVKDISHGGDFNARLFHHWPVFLSYFLGFFVLYSFWYQYHSLSQYVEGTNAWIVWSHGKTMAIVALLPFGTALLAENLNTPNQKWGIFYFGVLIFADSWLSIIMAAARRFRLPIYFSEDLPVDRGIILRSLLIYNSIVSIYGIVVIGISLIFPWVALFGYSLYILSKSNPTKAFNRMIPKIGKMSPTKDSASS